jgi:hypothetical protein
MLFRIRKSYKSALSAQAIGAYIESLRSKEVGFWIFKSHMYEVHNSFSGFSVRKRRTNKNSPAYPLITGKILEGSFVRVDLDIKPSYFFIALHALFPCVFLAVVLFPGKMPINGMQGYSEVGERILFAFILIGFSFTICYFNAIKPVRDAEKWLIDKFLLKEINSVL